jgi:hypothetical protein
MSENKPRQIIPGQGGVFNGMVNYIKLVLRLIADPRVSPWLKLIPAGTLVYLINPFDIPGPLDDAGIIGLGLYMFVELCPPSVVEEHRQAIYGVISGQISDPPPGQPRADEDDIIDADVREIK